MPVPLTYFVGDTLGAIAQDFWPDGYAWDMTVFEQNKPARAEDVTVIEQNAWIRLRDHIRQLLTSGFTKLGGYLTGSYNALGVPTPMPANTFAVQESWYNNTGQSVHVGNPDSVVDGSPNAVFVQLPAPPTSGTVNDLVYLEVWVQEVGAVGSTDTGGTNIVDRNVYKWGGIGNGTFANGLYWNGPSGPVEPVRRLQLRWAFRVARGAADITAAVPQGGAPSQQPSTSYSLYESFVDGNGATQNVVYRAGAGNPTTGASLHTVDGYVWATPIAIVARTAGVTNITSIAITDKRSFAWLTSDIHIKNTNIYPQLTVDSDLDHLVPVHFVYSGTAEASYGSQNYATANPGLPYTASFDLSQAAYGVRFTHSGGALTYATFNLSLAGTGADVVVEVRADAGSTPASTVLASGTIPAGWLTATPRDIAAYLNTVIAAGSYWLVVKKNGTGTNHAVLTGGAHADAGVTVVSAADGVTWVVATPFSFSAHAGVAGSLVLVMENATDLSYFEYAPDGTMSAIGEYYTPPAPAPIIARYKVVTYVGGTITDIT